MPKTAIGLRDFLSELPVVESSDQLPKFRIGLSRAITKTLLVMKLTIVLLITFVLNVNAKSVAQSVTLSGKDMTLKQVFSAIEKQTGYVFINNKGALTGTKTVSLTVNNQPLKELLDVVFKNQPLEYNIQGKTIIVSRKFSTGSLKDPPFPVSADQPVLDAITGIVNDPEGKALEGASVRIKGTKRGTSTDAKGWFTLKDVNDNEIIAISSVGYITLTVPVSLLINAANGEVPRIEKGRVQKKSAVDFTFSLQREETALEEVVVSTGMFDRKKETFTGVTRTITGKELRSASRINILEGLNMLDPSFKIIRNNSLGSDPNQLPKIEMRGTRSMPSPTPEKYSQQLKLEYEQDPNQPLFILDGFETNLNTIVNLDVNRIASITLLKDAASTALYGSRSANGVVVVETIRPTAGDLRVSYNATVNMSMPDLSSYNMMNAEELLRYQELTSMGPDAPGPFGEDAERLNLVMPKLKHDFRANAVLNGINSNWMKVPLQNAGALNHSLSVTGGDKFFNYNLGLNKGSNIGVMKGSVNKTTAGYANLSYRKRNLNISNNLNIAGQNQEAGPYGTFTQFVRIPPYYAVNKTDRYLEQHHAEYYTQYGQLSIKDFSYANPLYNAQLPYKNTVSGLTISNNLMANWDVYPFLRISGGIQYSKSNNQSDYFVSPLNTAFDVVEEGQKGRYDYSSSNSETFRYFLMGTYKKIFAEKHIVNMNVRSDVAQRKNEAQSVSAVGFATTAEPLLYLANSYTPFGKPGGSTAKSNSMALIGSVNYSYDMRYNFDLSYNLSGTSNFGSDNPYQSFYAFGVGWNIGREAFLANSKFVDQLNLSANFGLTGNQNAGNFGSRTTYLLNNDRTFFGESLRLMGLGNPDLDWTKTYNLSYSLSGRFFKNSLSLTLSGYRNLTDPLIITMPLPLSVGLPEGVPKNVGKLTSKGLELTLDARVVNTRNWTVSLGVNAPLLYSSKYSGLGNLLDKFNDSARNNNFMLRYKDGASPDDVWAVRSIGVGQGRGLEVFLDKDGNYTYLFNKNNEVALGSSRPVSQGNINIRARYKKFTISVYSRYIIKEMKFNNALYNKVENIDAAGMENNQDRRALYVRWKNIGDDASFLGIANNTLGMSSRFLQKENALFVDGINFNYDLLDQYSQGLKSKVRKKLGLQALSLGINTNNIFQFQLSNIKLERGLDYPFQRSVTINMNLTF